MKHVPLLSLVVSFCFALAAFTQETTPSDRPSRRESISKKRPPSVRELAALLQETIDLEGFYEPQSLKEAIARLQEKVKARGRELPILIDHSAFKEENPEAPHINDTQVQFQVLPRTMKIAHILHSMLSKVEGNATFLLRPGYLEVTTIDRADMRRLLAQAVHASFDRRPLLLGLEELYQSTGVPVIVDTRAWRQAQIPISGNFTNNPSLGGALLLLSEMAGLKMLVGDNMIYMTTPAHARQLLRERLWIPYHMQAGGPGGSPFGFASRVKRVE
jgi:hypothetical protein